MEASIAFLHDLRRLGTKADLIAALGVSEDLFDAVLAFDPSEVDTTVKRPAPDSETFEIPVFLRHNIPKRNKARGHRTVWEPLLVGSSYRALARRLGTFFEAAAPGYPHECAFGFRTGRNILENARVHTGRRHLLSLDIKDFFPSITVERVEQLFRDLGLNAEVARLLSRYVTIGGVLPAGLPTSPVLSNLAALPIDVALQGLASRKGALYTRYVDDLSFSSDDALPEMDEIEACLKDAGFWVEPSKTRRSRIGQSHFVTGLSVSDPLAPHVPKAIKRTLRQQLHYAAKYGLEDHLRHRGVKSARLLQQATNSLDGMVKFVSHHEPNLRAAVRSQWTEILSESRLQPGFAPKNQGRAPFDIAVDEAEFSLNGTPMLALGMSVSQHQADIVAATRAVLAQTLGDLFADGRVNVLREKGLHWADATEDLRMAYVTRLASLPFEGYVAFAPLIGPGEYQATYLRLLGALMPRRLMAAESRTARIYCEINSKVSKKAVQDSLVETYNKLAARNDRRPAKIKLAFVKKPNPGISVPDFLLGVLCRYLATSPVASGKPLPRAHLMFERLRDKYRLILDVRDWTEYSRRRPLEIETFVVQAPDQTM